MPEVQHKTAKKVQAQANGASTPTNIQRMMLDAANKILKKKEDIANLNDDVKEIKADLKAQGIDLTEFNEAFKWWEKSQKDHGAASEKLETFLYYMRSMGLGAQLNMFGDFGEETIKGDVEVTPEKDAA